MVLGTGFCLHHFADGPLAGLCFRAAFIFLGLLGFAIPMLFTVCHGRTSSASGRMTWSADQCQSILHRLQSGITAADVVPRDNHGLDLRATVEGEVLPPFNDRLDRDYAEVEGP